MQETFKANNGHERVVSNHKLLNEPSAEKQQLFQLNEDEEGANAQVAETPTLLGGTAINTPDKVKGRNSPKVQPFDNKSALVAKDVNDVLGATASIRNAATTEENYDDHITNNFDPPADIYEMTSNIDIIGASGKEGQAPHFADT